MINTLVDWVAAQLEAVSDLTGQVYKYASDNPEFPSALITFEGSPEAQMVSNKTTWRTYAFKVRIQYDLSSESISEAAVDVNLYNIADSVIDLFEEKRKVDGNADLLSPVLGETGWLDANRQVRYTDIRLEIKVTRDAA